MSTDVRTSDGQNLYTPFVFRAQDQCTITLFVNARLVSRLLESELGADLRWCFRIHDFATLVVIVRS